MLRRSVWLARRRPWATAALAACAVAALAASTRVLAPPAISAVADFPSVRASRVAHLLADVSAHTLTVPGSWTLEEEAGNYTSWRYTVSYTCGVRCAGRTAVEAHEQTPQPRHGLGASAHVVRVTHTHCTRPLLLPWPSLCNEMETESIVKSHGGADGLGARLVQKSSARCGMAAALLARCASARDLSRASDALLRRLRDSLHDSAHLAH